MSWSNLEQLVIPITMTTFMVVLSMWVPGLGVRGVASPPADPMPMVRSNSAPQGEPAGAEPRATAQPSAPTGLSAAARAAPRQVIQDPSADRDRATPAGGTNGPPGPMPVLRPPVAGPLVRGFEAPASPFGPGHRGVDFRARAGTRVTAPAPGRVRFAGRVGGVGWITVEIAPEVTVSVGPVGRIMVRAGDDVGALTVLGDAAAGHGGGVHLGLRVRGEYVDPQPYLSGFGLARLVPLQPPGPAATRRPTPTGDGSAARRRGGAPVAARRRRRPSGSGRATSRASTARRRPTATTRSAPVPAASRRARGAKPSRGA